MLPKIVSYFISCVRLTLIHSLVIKYGRYEVSALNTEREILGLDYISEAIIVGVKDEEFGQRVAAVVTLRDEVRLHPDELFCYFQLTPLILTEHPITYA